MPTPSTQDIPKHKIHAEWMAGTINISSSEASELTENGEVLLLGKMGVCLLRGPVGGYTGKE